MADYGYLLPTRGVVLSSDDGDELAARTESEVIGLARRAEATGFDGVWVGDSVLAKPRLDALTTLAAVATATDAAHLGTAVHLPALRHPVHVAHRTATLDQVSGGRLRFGVGVGIGTDVEAEYGNLGVEYGRRGRRLDETLDVLSALWSGGSVDYEGTAVDLTAASVGFTPAGEVPVYVASAAFDPAEGFPGPIRRRLAEHGDGWLPIGLGPDSYADGLGRVRSLLEGAGRDPGSVDPACYLDVVIDDEASALREARAFHDRYYPGRSSPSDEWLRERGAFGPPDAVAALVGEYADAGVETFVVRFPASDQRAQLRRFADAAL